MLGKTEIAGLIPHSGMMCLLDEVVSWDALKIRCTTRTHRDPRNPMRSRDELPALCGIEYAAQAMAVHGGLAGTVAAKPRAGYLVSVRDVVCRRQRLDDLEGELVVDAEQLMGDARGVMYRFSISAGETEILSGRATVVLDVEGT